MDTGIKKAERRRKRQ